jgi:diguanylate cyclase (GGDEF)-like protein
MKIDPRTPKELGTANNPRGVSRSAPVGASGQAAKQAGRAAPQDVTSIMGIPEEEFTPKVRAAIMMLMAEVESLRRELRGTQARLKHVEEMADKDTLTPAANRRAFVRELSRAMSYAERYATPSAVVYFDVDGLKAINDGFGHGAGDAALQRIAELFTKNIRESDIVGRLGGDEFGIILAHTDAAAAREKAMGLAKLVAETPLVWQGKSIALSVSYGTHAFQGGTDPAAALDAADKEMYARKRGQPAR